MIKFEPQIGQTSIKARDLDRNFARVQPIQNGQYGINQTEEGWSLNIFPPFPNEATQALALTYTGGSLQWRSLAQVADEFLATAESGGAVNSNILAPGDEGSLLITENSRALWSAPPPSGTPAWRQVERCDGQTMYVWGTEWA